jgi:hypothetical protein
MDTSEDLYGIDQHLRTGQGCREHFQSLAANVGMEARTAIYKKQGSHEMKAVCILSTLNRDLVTSLNLKPTMENKEKLSYFLDNNLPEYYTIESIKIHKHDPQFTPRHQRHFLRRNGNELYIPMWCVSVHIQ